MTHDIECFVPEGTPWDVETKLLDWAKSEYPEAGGWKIEFYGEQHKLTARKHGFEPFTAGVEATSSGDCRLWADFTWPSHKPKVVAGFKRLGAQTPTAKPNEAARTKPKGPTEETQALIATLDAVRKAHPAWGRRAIAEYLGIDSIEKIRHADRVSGWKGV